MTHGTIISQATVCESQPRKNASHPPRACTMATSSGSSAMNASQPIAAFGNASAKRMPLVMERRRRRSMGCPVTRSPGVLPGDWATGRLGNLFLEQRVERLPRVVRSHRLLAFVGGEVLHDLRREERAFVARVFAADALGDVFAALPQRRGVEEAAVAAGVEIGGALEAGVLERHVAQAVAQLAALIALEGLGAEAAGCPSARRAFEALLRKVGTRPLRPLLLLSAGVRVSASVLITTMLVLAIAQTFTSGRNARTHLR